MAEERNPTPESPNPALGSPPAQPSPAISEQTSSPPLIANEEAAFENALKNIADVAAEEPPVVVTLAPAEIQIAINGAHREVEHYDRQLERLERAEVVRLGKSSCPRNHFYDHHRFYYQWFDADRQSMRVTQTTEFCCSGLCHIESTAEYQLWQEKLSVWHKWSEASEAIGNEASSLSSLMREADAQERALLTDALAPSEISRDTQPAPETLFRHWPKPEQPIPGSWLTPEERSASKRRLIDALHSGALPGTLVTKREDGLLWLTNQPSVRYSGVTQLLSSEHLRAPDIWKEIVRIDSDLLHEAPDEILGDSVFFRWLGNAVPQGIRAAMTFARPNVLSDFDVMSALLEIDWIAVRRYASDDLRNDPRFAVLALQQFQQDSATTAEWLGPAPRDLPEVMAIAVMMSPTAVRSASPRLRNDREFARQILGQFLDSIESSSEQKKRADQWTSLEMILDRLQEEPLDDEIAMQSALLIDGRALRFCSERLRHDRLFIQDVIDQATQRFAPERATAICIWLCRSLPDAMRDDEALAMSAIEACSGQEIMDCWSDRLRSDKGFVLDALSRTIFRRRMLAALPEELRDDEAVVRAALQADGSAILSASTRLRHNKNFLRRAMAASTSEDSLKNVTQLAARFFGDRPESEREKHQRSFAANRQIVAICDLPEELRDDQELVVTALEYGSPLKGASERLINDPSFALKAIAAYGKRSHQEELRQQFSERVMDDLGSQVKDNEDVMLAAVERDGSTIRYASDRLRNQPTFAIEAIQVASNPEQVLQDLPAKVRDVDRVMIAAAELDPKVAQRFASDRLKKDSRFSQKIAEVPARPKNAERRPKSRLPQEAPEKSRSRRQVSALRPQTSPGNSVDFTLLISVGIGGLLLGSAVYSFVNGFNLTIVALSGIAVVIGALVIIERKTSVRSTPPRYSSRTGSADSAGNKKSEDVHYDREGNLERAKRSPKSYMDRKDSLENQG